MRRAFEPRELKEPSHPCFQLLRHLSEKQVIRQLVKTVPVESINERIDLFTSLEKHSRNRNNRDILRLRVCCADL